jgi:NADH-quinone oxidoreductase subunit G
LFQKLIRDLGVVNIDHRLQQSDFRDDAAAIVPFSNTTFAHLEQADTVLLMGSNIRREQPILANRVRKAYHNQGGQILAINPLQLELNVPVELQEIVHPDTWVATLAGLAKALGAADNSLTPQTMKASLEDVTVSTTIQTMAERLKEKNNSVLCLGALALNHPQASELRAWTRLIAGLSGAKLMELTPGANALGASQVGSLPYKDQTAPGLNAQAQFNKPLKAYVLFGIEPELDCANPHQVTQALQAADLVIAFSAYRSKALEQYADIMLPIAPFIETGGTFVNAQGDWQTFPESIPAQGEARPGWKVLRVFANILQLPNYEYSQCDDIRQELQSHLRESSHAEFAPVWPAPSITPVATSLKRVTEWPLYRIDSVVRRSQALQNCGASDSLQAVINPQLAKQKGLQEADEVRVSQNGVGVELAVTISDNMPNDVVYIPAAYDETAALGESFGAITIEKLS